MSKTLRIVLVVAMVAGIDGVQVLGQGSARVDDNVAVYRPASDVSGSLSSAGSDTLENLMILWSEDFKRHYPDVDVQMEAAGSSTAPPALTDGTANLGPMSRVLSDREIEAFEKKHGYPPTMVRVGIDVLAVYVNQENPVEGLTVAQVDAIFSSTGRCGHRADITRWGQVGMTGAWTTRKITLYGRNAISGTYAFFKEHALCGGEYKSTMNEQADSAGVVRGVSQSIDAVGYSGIGYITAGVRAVPLASKVGERFQAPTQLNAESGAYPLTRFLYIAVNKPPDAELPRLESEFLKMVLSKQGQEAVVRDGYIPLPATVVQEELEKTGLTGT